LAFLFFGPYDLRLTVKRVRVEGLRQFNAVKDIVDENKGFYGFAELRGAYIKAPDGWRNALTKVVLLKKDAKKEPDEEVNYGGFILIKKTIPLDVFLKTAEKLFSESILMLDKFSCQLAPPSISTWDYPSNDFYDWAGKLFEISGGKLSIPERPPLVDYSNPPFQDAYHAISKWLDLFPFHRTSDARLGSVLVFLPEYRARIKSIRYADKKLSLKAEFNIPKLTDVRCKAIIRTSSGQEIQSSLDFKTDETEFPLESPPDETYVYLVTSDNRILDTYEETVYRHSGRVRLIANAIGLADIEVLILAGENEVVEFKERVEEDKTKKDLIRTAVAFANTKGGKIFIGISDNAEIIGVNREIEKDGESKLKEKFDSILRDNVRKPLKYSMEVRKVSDKSLLIIHVQEGEFKPYATRDNEIFIRVGGTDRRPDPDTELPALFPKYKSK